jgi:hypothetical protein
MSVRTRRVSMLAMAAAATMLWSCGGSGSGDGGTPPPPEPPPIETTDVVTIGTITAFGSVTVNGRTYDTSATAVQIEDEPSTIAQLRLGQRIRLAGKGQGAAYRADVIRYHDNLEGPIGAVSVSESSFIAMGQTVLVTSSTTLGDGISPASIEGFSVGDLVEVSGLVDEAGRISATRVDLKHDGGPYDVTGVVGTLSAAQHRFSINALVVDYSSANMLDFPSGAPASGDLVLVKGLRFAADGAFIATEVELRSDDWLRLREADLVSIEGLINSFASPAAFEVAQQPVATTPSTVYLNGTVSDLALGVKVVVEGSIDGAGVLAATRVKFLHTNSVRIQASVESVVYASGEMTLLGLRVRTDESTRFEDRSIAPAARMSLGDLNVGDWVDLRGVEDPVGSNAVLARRVERITAQQEVRLRGPFRAASAPAFQILSVGVATGLQTRFVLEYGIRLSAGEFFAQAPGEIVEAWGLWESPTLGATRVEIKVLDD